MMTFLKWLLSFFGVTATSTGTITDAQAATVALCGFLPAAASVATLFASAVPALTTAVAVASAICSVVSNSKPPAALMAASMTGRIAAGYYTVHGVNVSGTFIGK